MSVHLLDIEWLLSLCLTPPCLNFEPPATAAPFFACPVSGHRSIFSENARLCDRWLVSMLAGVAARQLCPKLCAHGAGHVVVPCAMVVVSPGAGAKNKTVRVA